MAGSQILASSELSIARRNRALWHRPGQEECLGCCICSDHHACGGMRMDSEAFDCVMACECTDPNTCELVCPKNPAVFVARVREINGFGFEGIAAAPPATYSRLPRCVPLLYHKSRRTHGLETNAVAIPLSKLFHGRSGEPRFTNKQDLAKTLGFSPSALLVITGVDHEQPIENYWSNARRCGFAEALGLLNPTLVTTPNFSLFTDVPRWDNLYNVKRIAICWHEFADLGLPAALHVNARTDRDWERWTEFLRAHDEIGAVAFEFKTGGANVERGRWHAGQLARLAADLDRPIRLIVRGGRVHLPQLSRAFARVVFVSADPFLKATKRRKLIWAPGMKPRWIRVLTLNGQPLDELLQHNVDTYTCMVTSRSLEEHGVVASTRN